MTVDVLNQENFDFVLDRAAFGNLSPYVKSQHGGLPHMFAYPDETIHWVANVTVDSAMWGIAGTSTSFSLDVFVGVSQYRLVFYREHERIVKENKQYCKSYWFDIDFEGRKWTRYKRKKPIYFTDVRMAEPKFSTGLMAQGITIKNLLSQDNGKVHDFFNSSKRCEITRIKWLEPGSGKKIGRKADAVYQSIMEAYQNQVPVKPMELVLLYEDPDLLAKHLSDRTRVTEIEGQIIHQPSSDGGVKEKSTSGASKPQGKKQIVHHHCGQQIQPGWKICPACGEALAPLCESCGQELDDEWKVCPQCGTKVT